MKVNVYNKKGEVVTQAILSDALFGVSAKPSLLHFVVTALTANRRRPTAHTKQRGEVRGGGKKPWKQKGTGRARHGSIRSPLWRGGGIVFGPRNDRNYTQKVNKKLRKKVLAMCLSDKVTTNRFVLVDHFDEGAVPKTKHAVALLRALGIPERSHSSALIIVPTGEVAARALRNISGVRTAHVDDLSVLDVVRYPYLVTTPDMVQKMEERFGN